MPDPAEIRFASFGIEADTGRPLPDPNPVSLTRKSDGDTAAQQRGGAVTFGATIGINEEEIAETGWGLVFADDDPRTDAIEAALKPLLDRRRAEAGPLFKIFKDVDGIRAGDTAESWLDRQGVGLDLVVPARGVPYYLMLVGSPGRIPPEFQYRLDLYWAVGRLYFERVEDYAAYAANIDAYEGAQAPIQSRNAAVFAPTHNGDRATELFHDLVVQTLLATPALNGFAWDAILADAATKSEYAALVSGQRSGGPPAVIFSGGHGMDFRADDPRLPATEGALVCGDWQGIGGINASHWFAASDLPAGAPSAAGSIYLLFACYGGGYSAIDTFRDNGAGRKIADHPGVARLPQAMLANPQGGPLAVIAHIDRAFAYSFASLRLAEQSQGFQSVLGGLMLGRRVGSALDRFNVKWASIATQLADLYVQGVDPSDRRMTTLWIARDDARNYIVYGDPAVRLHPALTKPPLR